MNSSTHRKPRTRRATILKELIGVGLLLALTTSLSYGQLSGSVFRDFNGDGKRQSEALIEPGVAKVKVQAFVAGVNTPLTTVTDASGAYSFAIDGSKQVRLEFSDLPFGSFSGIEGADNRSSVQFVNTPNTQANLALVDPHMYSANNKPEIVLPVQLVGDPLKGDADMNGYDALVQYQYSATGQRYPNTANATFGQVGALWGTSYQRQSKKLFSSALLKRHSGLGSLGLGGIYITDLSGGTATTSPYVDLSKFVTLAENIATEGIKNRTLTTDYTKPQTDSVAFALVGKAGLGGMAISPDESKIWVVNLYEKSLVSVAVGVPAKSGSAITAADIKSYTIPTPDESKGKSRPWAVTYREGALYVGVTTDASSSGATRADLKAYVYRFDLKENKFDTNPVFSTTLDYRKGWVHSRVPQSEYWESWSDDWSAYTTSELGQDDTITTYRISYPQPILSAIEFDVDGSLILGLMDRAGHQTGRNQLGLSASNDRFSGYVGGDLLRAQFNAVAGTFTLENNGKSGSLTSAGAGNNQGPGGGEFFFEEDFKDNFSDESIQEETFMGSLLMVPGSKEVVATTIEPFTTWSGGALWFSTQDGSRLKGMEVYDSNPIEDDAPIKNQFFGNSNGLGALTALYKEAPIQVGNRVWADLNKDGIQNPGEESIAGMKVALFGEDFQLKKETVTDAEGKYLFTTPDIESNRKYHIVFGIGSSDADSQFDDSTQIVTVSDVSYKLTVAKTGEGAEKNYNDSDAILASDLSAALNGYPVITFNSGAAGQNNQNLDAGFITCWADAGKDTTICLSVGVVQLKAADKSQAWAVAAGNPSAAVINANGLVEGFTKAGTYAFVLSQGQYCKDTVKVTVKDAPVAKAVALQPTCTDLTVNNNGIIKLLGFESGYRFNVSLGDKFDVALFETPQAVPTDGVLINDIENPVSGAQAYTVRLYNEIGCTTDLVVNFTKKDCECGGVAAICVPFVVTKTK